MSINDIFYKVALSTYKRIMKHPAQLAKYGNDIWDKMDMMLNENSDIGDCNLAQGGEFYPHKSDLQSLLPGMIVSSELERVSKSEFPEYSYDLRAVNINYKKLNTRYLYHYHVIGKDTTRWHNIEVIVTNPTIHQLKKSYMSIIKYVNFSQNPWNSEIDDGSKLSDNQYNKLAYLKWNIDE